MPQKYIIFYIQDCGPLQAFITHNFFIKFMCINENYHIVNYTTKTKKKFYYI